MTFSQRVRLELEDARLLDCYTKNETIWHELALIADQAARQYLPEPPLAGDVVEALLPALRANKVWRKCLADVGLSGSTWYRYFAEYIVHRQWKSILADRP